MIMMSQFWDLRVFQVQKYFFPLCDVKVFIYLEHVGHNKTLTTIKFVFYEHLGAKDSFQNQVG